MHVTSHASVANEWREGTDRGGLLRSAGRQDDRYVGRIRCAIIVLLLCS